MKPQQSFVLSQELLSLENAQSYNVALELDGDGENIIAVGSEDGLQKLIADVLNQWSEVLLSGAYEDQEIQDIATSAVQDGLQTFDQIEDELTLCPLHERQDMSYEEYSDLYLLN